MGSCVCRPRSMRCIWGLRSPRAVPGLVRRFVLSCCALPWPTVPRVCMEEVRCSVQDTGRNSMAEIVPASARNSCSDEEQ